ncbi:hypothetical protein BV394_16075 (plasmid) [Brevirhabdus pacifica]|uniref:Uncharacterized protein n=1 Tax=Brevirhabdus pacifica TaxID=1267768 RepID=A0A1P8QYF9_9RHOB|nr:glycosyltransferase family 4 protein [Brevirhabdus pacifica]APX91407.1 hypothetical protein BV394_16075 [Brevirhabdus pacifica]PJJ78959.1 glycosyltransferase involved in cell wall biosynthesis [Brevirhabdus pacifica]
MSAPVHCRENIPAGGIRRRLLLAHSDLDAGGGAELYARAIRDRLRGQGHLVDTLDIHGIRTADADDPAPLPLTLRTLLALGRLPVLRRRHLLRHALVCRALPRFAPGYDAVILSYGEGPALPCPVLTLRHAPALFSTRPALLAVLGRKSPLRGPYTRLCRRIAGLPTAPRPDSGPASGSPGHQDHPGDLVLANSAWTAARVVEHGLTRRPPAVLYPPVRAIPPATAPVQLARDPHLILALGRIVPGKRLEEAVAILTALRRQGHPARLAIVGRAEGAYARRLLARLAPHPGLELHPDASPSRLATLLARASLGLHCYRQEHFGIAVAEMITAGILPVVHDGGGVAELVPDPALRFADPAGATRRLARLLALPLTERARMAHCLGQGKALKKALDFEAELDRVTGPFLARLPGPGA